MNPIGYAARLGVRRGLREFRQSLVSGQDLFWFGFLGVSFVAVLFFQRHSTVKGTHVSLAFAVLPSMLGMLVAMGGYQGAANALVVEREDGTLLRAKAVPNGMVGYLTGRIVSVSLSALLTIVIILFAGLFIVPDLARTSVGGWLSFLAFLMLGLLATLPWGAIVGSLANSPTGSMGLTMLPLTGLTAISGIFYPISAMPGWVQGVAQLFPVYWLGLGMRASLLPGSAVHAEIGHSWRHLETVGVLGVWAVVGLLLAPGVLRRMARKESASAMDQRRQRALQRIA